MKHRDFGREIYLRCERPADRCGVRSELPIAGIGALIMHVELPIARIGAVTAHVELPITRDA